MWKALSLLQSPVDMFELLMIIVVTGANSAKFYTKLAYRLVPATLPAAVNSLLSPYSKTNMVQDIKIGIQVERTLPGKTEEKIFSTHLF